MLKAFKPNYDEALTFICKLINFFFVGKVQKFNLR